MSPQAINLSRRTALQATSELVAGVALAGCLSGAGTPGEDEEGRARIGRLDLMNRDPREYEATVRVAADGETVHESTHTLPPRSDGTITVTELDYTTDEARAYVVGASTASGSTETLDVGEFEDPCDEDCDCLGLTFEVHEGSLNGLVGHLDDCEPSAPGSLL